MENASMGRVSIRRMALTDLQDYLAYQIEPENPPSSPIEQTPEEKAKIYLERQATLEIGDEGGWLGFGVELLESGRVIGEVGVYLKPPENLGDIGWVLNPDYRGHGYATEAARLLLAYVFEERDLHRVTANCEASNTPSVKIMERLGMRREAHFRESRLTAGVWQDEYQYALLRSEWLERER